MTSNGAKKSALAILIASLLLTGCGNKQSARTGDPLTDIRNPALSDSVRIASVHQAAVDSNQGKADPVETRRVLKDTAWARAAPSDLRLAVLEALFDDRDADEDSLQLASFLLPQEKNPEVVAFVADTAIDRQWKAISPALIRCYARRDPTMVSPDRPEHRALLSLNPDRTIEQIVFEIFLVPGIEGGVFGIDWADLTRADAWDLLARLDADGSIRAGFLVSDEYNTLTGESAILRDDLRAGYNDLHAIPLNAAELTWLRRLRDPEIRINRVWWNQARLAMDAVPQQSQRVLNLRHVEPIRWAAQGKPEWLAMDRDALYAELDAQLAGRTFHRRSARNRESDRRLQERLDQSGAKFRWADLLAILVVNEAIAQDSIRSAFFEQAQLDMDDKTTEYGGTLSSPVEGDNAMRATLFPPRPASRMGDERFVASADMLRSSDGALAHYHFHAQRWGNASFAGPSPDDRVYAWRQGRSCLVLTAIRKGVLAVDYYQPNGLILDLGEITSP